MQPGGFADHKNGGYIGIHVWLNGVSIPTVWCLCEGK